MSERESTKLRDLKEAAYALYQRGRYAQCAETYAQLARRLPRDANVRVRLAEACRRAGHKEQAIAAYRESARILLSLGCESRARGALKAALELDPRDATLQTELVRLGQGADTAEAIEEEALYRFDRLPPPTPPPARMRSVPPPSITPVCIRGAPNAIPGPGRQVVDPHSRPTAPAVTAMRDAATETLSRSMAGMPRPQEVAPLPKVIVSMSSFEEPPAAGTARATTGNTPPGIAPVAMGRALSQKGPLGLPAPLRSLPGALSSQVTPAPIPERPTVKVLALRSRAPEAQPTTPLPHANTHQPHAPALTAPPSVLLPYKPEMRRLAPNVVALRVSPQARWVIIRSQSELEVSRSEELPDGFASAH
ncbi:hypothetical protein [Corallococcus sp. EGB]|uniref:hypothetical protein n=1 Tax=Corallococcus sp. EGB TaxID=1521117 RepID=UPI001CBFA067|nr:hypothetical protein [Corallococcus sp. EGB]